MSLDLGERIQGTTMSNLEVPKPKRTQVQPYVIADDENLDWEDSAIDPSRSGSGKTTSDPVSFMRKHEKGKKSLLEVDSSGMGNYSIHDSEIQMEKLDMKHQDAGEADMAKALKEVEGLRLEMQRASERIQASNGIPPEGTLIKKKKNKKSSKPGNGLEGTTALGTHSVDVGVVSQSLDSSNNTPKSKSKKKRKSTATSMHNSIRASP